MDSVVNFEYSGSLEAMSRFLPAIETLARESIQSGVEINCEMVSPESCPVCHGSVVGTALSDGSLSFYCLDCDTDLKLIGDDRFEVST